MKTSLAVKDLSHSYGRISVLNAISFSVQEGEFFIIIGPNGSGKTTLARTISGTLEPQRGQIEILRRPIRSYSGKALARSVAVVAQAPPADIPFAVADVVLMGRSPHLSLLAIEKLKDLELAERAMAFTNVEHLAGRRFDQLSAGERRSGFYCPRHLPAAPHHCSR